MTRGARTRVAKGIYRDASGLAAVVTVGKARREQRFKLDADLDDIKEWQRTTRGQLLLDTPTRQQTTRRGELLERAVSRYLALIAGRPGYASDRAHLTAWLDALGERERASITAEDIRATFATWRTEGQRRPHQTRARPVSPQTLRHRYRVLKRLWRVLDGPGAKTPLDDIPRPVVPRTVPRDVPLAVIKKVEQKLRAKDPCTHARFLVLATTGKAPAEVMRATPEDVSLKARTWFVRPAKGRAPQVLQLGPEMVAAWRQFIEAKAWGEYDTTRYARILRSCGWPAGIRPYNLRHALAIELLRRGADLSDIQAHLGHTSMETTRRHYAGLLEERAKATTKLLDARLGLMTPRPAKAARLSATRVPRTRESTREKVRKRESS